jgi:hypothetical protein
MDVDCVIAALSSARAMISHDDGDITTHAVWMPPDSPVIVLLHSKRHHSVRQLSSWKTVRTIIVIPMTAQDGHEEA